MTIYRDDEVSFGGLAVGGIRISHMSNLDKETIIVVNKSKGKKVGMKILPLVAQADKVADGVKALIDRIKAGEDVTAEPAVVKQREWLAKNRPELATEVEAALASVQPSEDPFEEKRADEDTGENLFDAPDPRQAKADEIIAAAGNVTTKAELAALKDQYGPDIDAMPDELLPVVAGAIAGAEKRAK